MHLVHFLSVFTDVRSYHESYACSLRKTATYTLDQGGSLRDEEVMLDHMKVIFTAECLMGTYRSSYSCPVASYMCSHSLLYTYSSCSLL